MPLTPATSEKPASAGEAAGEKRRLDQDAVHRDAGEARSGGVVADRAHLEAEGGAGHDEPDQDRRNESDGKAEMQPPAGDQARQAALGE